MMRVGGRFPATGGGGGGLGDPGGGGRALMSGGGGGASAAIWGAAKLHIARAQKAVFFQTVTARCYRAVPRLRTEGCLGARRNTVFVQTWSRCDTYSCFSPFSGADPSVQAVLIRVSVH